MSSDSFAVVEFVDEKAVEVVAKSWIETCDGDLYCYWPRTNVSLRVKKLELPDKNSWKKYKIRIFSYTDSLVKAKNFAKKALATSNIESDEDPDCNVPRKRVCIRSSMEDFPDYSDTDKDDDNDEQERPQHVPSQRAKLPIAPSFKPSVLPRKPNNERSPPQNAESVDIIEDSTSQSGSMVISALSQILSTDPSSIYNDLVTISHEDILDTQPLQEAPSCSTFHTPSQSNDIFDSRHRHSPLPSNPTSRPSEACLRVHRDCNEATVEEQISEVLKYAPSKAGGSRFKVTN
ncbi:uncharacterized protein LOC114517166 [Dendronephthya gigantea]|uniref:uncharacterized protein LOC114517166 n=1 Tax=Dendronephthya gigantea TaxID=151771 RepID=UPI00106A8192|nr:uncharacterized protein LOC114517166 [Dendronephthya gigantea]